HALQKSADRLYASTVCRRLQSGNRAERRGGAMMRLATMVRTRKIAPILAMSVAVALALISFGAALAQSPRAASTAEYSLVGDEGQRPPNHTVRLWGRSTDCLASSWWAIPKARKR